MFFQRKNYLPAFSLHLTLVNCDWWSKIAVRRSLFNLFWWDYLMKRLRPWGGICKSSHYISYTEKSMYISVNSWLEGVLAVLATLQEVLGIVQVVKINSLHQRKVSAKEMLAIILAEMTYNLHSKMSPYFLLSVLVKVW